MTTPDLIRELETVVKEFIQTRQWGRVEVLFQKGAPTIIRKEITKNLKEGSQGNTHEQKNR